MKSDDSGMWLAYLCFFGLLVLAISLVAFMGYQVAPSLGLAPLLGLILGVIAGAFALGVGIASSGIDMTDFAVNSVIVIVLTLMLLPVTHRARENAQRRAIKQLSGEHGAIYPQPIKKGTQLLR